MLTLKKTKGIKLLTNMIPVLYTLMAEIKKWKSINYELIFYTREKQNDF